MDLPDELWLLVITSLATSTLLKLVHVSRRLCRISLDVLLLRDENQQADIDRGHLTLTATASKLLVIPHIRIINNIDIRRITIVVRGEEDVEELLDALGRQFSAQIPDFRVRFHPTSPETIVQKPRWLFFWSNIVVDLVEHRLPENPEGNYLIIREGAFKVSVPRETPRREQYQNPMGHTRFHRHLLFGDSCLRFLLSLCRPECNVRRLSILPIVIPITVILAPFLIPFDISRMIAKHRRGRLSQRWRLLVDLEVPPMGPRSEFGMIDLPFKSNISKFIIVDPSTVKQLTFGPFPHLSQAQIFAALESVDLPCLEEIAIDDNWKNIDFPLFIQFISSHAIRRLTLNGVESLFDTLVSQLSTIPANGLDGLEFISGPPRNLNVLLTSGLSFQRLTSISLNCQCRASKSRFSTRRDSSRSRQVYKELEESFKMISSFPAIDTIKVVLLWNQGSVDWLTQETNAATPSSRCHLQIMKDEHGIEPFLLKHYMGNVVERFPLLHVLSLPRFGRWSDQNAVVEEIHGVAPDVSVGFG
ncbi:hypothetical protein C8J56DRAFT_280887 [Mycena floridula]|nr:hypothetical protein C8J56DRAFT_280887 [Mycena floridula]